ncbi:MAG: hypothetical protein JWN52_4322 [Actinomycetia bacterium]|jgi:hypothetical protein|nr:hypothetical protein [Actinomycetes bacterium]
MTARSTALALTGAAALTLVLVTASSAHASFDAWRFVTQYRSLTACGNAGKDLVARHTAREFKCENDYTEAGAPALDLYVR